jgi:hypothetical protein
MRRALSVKTRLFRRGTSALITRHCITSIPANDWLTILFVWFNCRRIASMIGVSLDAFRCRRTKFSVIAVAIKRSTCTPALEGPNHRGAVFSILRIWGARKWTKKKHPGRMCSGHSRASKPAKNCACRWSSWRKRVLGRATLETRMTQKLKTRTTSDVTQYHTTSTSLVTYYRERICFIQECVRVCIQSEIVACTIQRKGGADQLRLRRET